MSRRTVAGRFGALLAVVCALALPAAAGAADLPAGATVAISGTPDLQSLFPTPAAPSTITGQAVDRGGDRVVFASASDGLVADDDDTVINVYVKDVATGEVQLVSRSSDVVGTPGEPSHANCSNATISADGHVVAFICDGPLDAVHDTNGKPDAYVRNLDTGQTTLVDRGTDGMAGNAGVDAGSPPAVAHDGASGRTYVAFVSASTNLLGTALPNAHVFRRTLGASDAMDVVDVLDPAHPNASTAFAPSISDDGQRVAFLTAAPLDPHDAGRLIDAYVRDFAASGGAPPITLASAADGAAGAAAGNVLQALISGDGASVAFSTPTSLDARDTDATQDVYVRSGTTTRLLTIGSTGERPGADCTLTGIDGDGQVVAFSAQTTALAPGLTAADGAEAYVSRTVNGAHELDLVSRGPDAGPPAARSASGADPLGAVSGDGAKVAIAASVALTPDADPGVGAVVLRDLDSGDEQTVSRPAGSDAFVNLGGTANSAVPSADGRYVAFAASVPGLGLPSGVTQAVYRRDLQTGALVLVSRDDGSAGAPLGGSFGTGTATSIAISADGDRVAFEHAVAGQPKQILVRDVAAARTLVASRPDGPDAANGPLGDGDSSGPTISADGRRVAFVSTATDLVGADDADARPDAFVRELDAGRTLLVDRAAGAGAKAAAGASGPKISADGRFVAFSSADATLVPGDGNGKSDAFVRGLDDGSLRLVSVNGTTPGDGDSFAAGISANGARVAILSLAPDFGVPAGANGLFVRDLASPNAPLVVAGRADGPGGAFVDARNATLSADGLHVAFEAAPATGIAPGAPGDGVTRDYERDLASGATRLISRANGANGIAVGGVFARMTADGGCVTFQSTDPVVPFGGADLKTNVYLRAVEPNCGRSVTGPVSPPPPPPTGTKPAVVSHLSVKPARFFVVVRGVRGGGTTIAFRLDKSSSVTLSFDRLLAGRLKGKRCLTTVRKGRRCTVVKRAGHLTVSRGRAGVNTVKFSGKLGRKALAPGTYRLTATPLHGKAVSVRFVVVKAPKQKPKRKAHP